MGKALDTAMERLRALPDERQEAFASILPQEIEAEAAWDERFARSPDPCWRVWPSRRGGRWRWA